MQKGKVAQKPWTEHKQIMEEFDGIKVEISEEGQLLSAKQNDKNSENNKENTNVSQGVRLEIGADLVENKISAKIIS